MKRLAHQEFRAIKVFSKIFSKVSVKMAFSKNKFQKIYFKKCSLKSYISRNYFEKLPPQKYISKTFIFQETKLFYHKFKKLIFQEELQKTPKSKLIIFLSKNLWILRETLSVIISVFLENWIKQHYCYIKSLNAFFCVESFFSF